MTNAIAAEQQKLDIGSFVQLFTLDTSKYGGPIFYWTPTRTTPDQPITWQGQNYTPIDVQVSGFDKPTAGTLPRPQVTLGNANNIIGALLVQYNGLRGCLVTRTKTLFKFLDDQPDADPTACWPIDIFRIERKTSHNKQQVTIELAAATDNAQAKIPGRPALREVCTHIYRAYDPDTGDFDYTIATCPYTGTDYFTQTDTPCDITLDNCSHQLSGCKLRFGTDPLPTRAFPALNKANIS